MGSCRNSFPPVGGTNSTTTNYITGTANSNSNEDNFRLFESIVINLTETTLAVACVASVSSRGSSRKLGQEPKKMNDLFLASALTFAQFYNSIGNACYAGYSGSSHFRFTLTGTNPQI